MINVTLEASSGCASLALRKTTDAAPCSTPLGRSIQRISSIDHQRPSSSDQVAADPRLPGAGVSAPTGAQHLALPTIRFDKLGFHTQVHGQRRSLTYSFKHDLFYYKERYCHSSRKRFASTGEIELVAAYRQRWCIVEGGPQRPMMRQLSAPEVDLAISRVGSVTDVQRIATLQACGLELGLVTMVDGRAVWPYDAASQSEIPAQVISIWVGRHRIPDAIIQVINANAAMLKRGWEKTGQHFGFKLYLSTASESYRQFAERNKIIDVEIVALEQSDFFRDFKAGSHFRQYQAALQGNGGHPDGRTHYASGADLLRFLLLKHEGGIYLDIDDRLKDFPQKIDRRMPPNGMMFGSVLSMSTMGMRDQFGTSIFATQKGNPILDKIAQEMQAQFARDPFFYVRWKKGSMNDYAVRLSQMTGPALVNRVLCRELPVVNQVKHALALLINTADEADVPMYQELRAMVNRSYVMRLADKHVVGNLNSWKFC